MWEGGRGRREEGSNSSQVGKHCGLQFTQARLFNAHILPMSSSHNLWKCTNTKAVSPLSEPKHMSPISEGTHDVVS